jgi:hypothetical protein
LQGRLHQAGRRDHLRGIRPDRQGEIVFDFTERISVTIPDSIAISDGKVPAITPTVTTTGGTKTVDKSVKNQTYAWNANFVSWVKAKTKAHIDDIEKEGYLVDYYQNEVVGDLVGLSSFRCCVLLLDRVQRQHVPHEQGLQILLRLALSL